VREKLIEIRLLKSKCRRSITLTNGLATSSIWGGMLEAMVQTEALRLALQTVPLTS
jgi:hypothetical protein